MLHTIRTNRANVLRRFGSFFIIWFLMLLLELSVVAALLFALEISYVTAIACSFLFSITISYVLLRKYTFKGTSRSVTGGYVYFCIIAAAGLGIVTGGSWLLTTYAGLHPLIARFLLGGLTGLLNFLVNLVYNFKVAHHPH